MMRRWSQCFIPTLRHDPGHAESISHKLLVRSGYVRPTISGSYANLFLGRRSMLKISAVVREEMDCIGQEVLLPSQQNKNESSEVCAGRPTVNDASRPSNHLGFDLEPDSTDAEVVAVIARGEIRSYKQLPQIWYQMQTRLRDEARTRSGLLLTREFMVCDSYALDFDAVEREASYRKHYEACCRILDRCGLKYAVVEGGGDVANATQAQEFVVYADAGEEVVATCSKCSYAANVELARSAPGLVQEPEDAHRQPIEVATPTQRTIEEVAAFLGIQPSQVIKSYLAVANTSAKGDPAMLPVAVFLRGDHSVNETKVRSVLEQAGFRAAGIRPMEADEIRECFGLEPGFIGPVGLSAETFPVAGRWLKPQFIFDLALKGRRNLVGGANKRGFHVVNVTPNDTEGFMVSDDQWFDVRNVMPGEGCPHCGTTLAFKNAIKVGRIAKLSSAYSESMGMRVTDDNGRELPTTMGVSRIWLDRILVASVEKDHDEHGFWLAPTIAPFSVVVVPTNISDEIINSAAADIARALEAAGVDVLLDDRDERPGVKFKDADLIGVPYRINIGKKVAEGVVELFTRHTNTKEDVRPSEIVEHVLQRVHDPS